MSQPYRIRLASKNEGLDYEDESGFYRFNVNLRNGVWTVGLPPSKGQSFLDAELTSAESERILPRIRGYLGRIWWLGVFPRSYEVVFQSQSAEARPAGVLGAYRIGFVKGRKHIQYRDDVRAYEFAVTRQARTWLVKLPPTLSEDERGRIEARVRSYLSLMRGMFGMQRYQVQFVDE
jgi:hypothetical protein